jgi:hypothetical protein
VSVMLSRSFGALKAVLQKTGAVSSFAMACAPGYPGRSGPAGASPIHGRAICRPAALTALFVVFRVRHVRGIRL